MFKKALSLLLVFATMTLCCVAAFGEPLTKTYGVTEYPKFDSVYLNVSIEDFLDAGFKFGDSCNIVFSNGKRLDDLPFYTGYYVRTGEPLIVGYPGNPNISVTRNNEGLWTELGLTENDTAEVTLAESGKYLQTQEALNQVYSTDLADYDSEIQFANFRTLRGGHLKEDFLYRGATPVDNRKNRAPVVDALLKEHGIRFILDLADTEEDVQAFRENPEFASPYTAEQIDEGHAALLGMSSSYGSEAYQQKLASGLRKLLSSQGPAYIHCLEGKDRTGFVCFLIEALAGASYDEMLADYMTTYDNYYGIREDTTPEKYLAIAELYFDSFAAYLHGTEDAALLKTADYTEDAANYLLRAGMTEDEVAALQEMITEEEALEMAA